MGRQVLSTWNQIAPRAYQRQCFCFPYRQGETFESLENHLRLALDRLGSFFPHLSGKISLLSSPVGYVCIDTDGHARIPLKICDARSSYQWTYAQLKSQGFPARAFVDKSFDLPYRLSEDGDGIPVLEIHIRLIEGGLLLCVYSHHSISDGTSVYSVISCFADLTRDSEKPVAAACVDIQVDLPEQVHTETTQNSSDTFHELLSECSEYCTLSSPTGPTQFRILPKGMPLADIGRTGRIFVIGTQQIDSLKHKLAESSRRAPSTFTCLAALTWAHVTKARLSSPKNLLSSSSNENIPIPENVNLMVSTDWRQRAFADIMSSSAGNTVALPKTRLNTKLVLAACSAEKDISFSALEAITGAIHTMVHNVDDNFVALRTALFRTAPDPRLIGVDADQRDPRDFYFNTWRHFGGSTRWKIPGVVEEDGNGGVAPDAIRRAQADWNMGAGLVLPARKGCSGFEVLVTLDVDSMEVLCENAGWKDWVGEIFE